MPKRTPLICVTKSVDEIDDILTGQKLRAMREAAKVSLAKIAARMSRSVPYLSDLELGRRGWSEDRAKQFVAAIKELAATKPKLGAVPVRRSLK